ncbi:MULTISPECIES: response regulator transcription factor [Paenibacillus]|uniref:Winged helix family two component transcriptional regulator n=1 Tax=Paenibacillus illinoisensis TaxID=59845 RepID=A0A2W0C9F4_9BACL|nr:response regulator transcription factor [Paenibacillus illinoisensis]MBM6383579.1 response regulator transcription factor [Paenibacillus sp.]PYY29250.1 Winged helix family two component transcriptional regulator [Paenibacillus illinoisensis]
MNEAILVIEDEPKIARLLELELQYEGYQVGKAGSGTEGLDMYHGGQWDLILLDIMLPGLSGIEVLRRIRARDAMVPILMLTAKDSVEDKVSGLDLGANDYITKPFRIEELLARVRAALRLSAAAASSSGVIRHANQDTTSHMTEEETGWLTAAGLKLNEGTREVSRDGIPIELTPREFDLLVYLLQNQRQVLSRDQIVQAVWGYDYYGDTNVVDVYIRYVRKKVDNGFTPPLIHTVRGVGYVLKEQS